MQIALVASEATTLDGDVLLVKGAVSDASLRALKNGETTDTLASRRVSARVRTGSQTGQVWVEPLTLLEPGETYSVVRSPAATVQTFVVDASPVPVLSRSWPTLASAEVTMSVFCGEGPLETPASVVGGDGSWTVKHGIVDAPSDRCVTLSRDCLSSSLVLPVALTDASTKVVALFDPSAPAVSSNTPVVCGETRARVGPLCIEIQDDRAVFSRGSLPALVTARLGPQVLGGVVDRSSLVLLGLVANEPFGMALDVVDASGVRRKMTVEGTTTPARPHVVIDEVLADPDGPEPAGEWIEIVNDGTRTENLAGWGLEDGGGTTALVAVDLLPGQVGILLNADAPPSLIASLPADAARIVVPRVGKAGLSNSGEALTLHDSTGLVVSRFPASPKPRPNRSVQRRSLLTADDDTDGFVLADPTPGRL